MVGHDSGMNRNGKVVHIESSIVYVKPLKARMISAPILLIPKVGHKNVFFWSRLMQVRLVSPRCFFKKIPLDL